MAECDVEMEIRGLYTERPQLMKETRNREAEVRKAGLQTTNEAGQNANWRRGSELAVQGVAGLLDADKPTGPGSCHEIGICDGA